ncbi:MAG: Rieske (2Fe-2S) protein [Candidatus Marinimicrobia bacterium]|nr:Rieske (2Fe-2S) protein [Candidatus Neomarinimicrobiota bacterium]
MKYGRREFINTMLGAGGIGGLASIFYPVFQFMIPPKISEPHVSSLKVGTVDEFPINSSKIVRFGRVPVILIRNDQDTFSALAATCTHLDCIVQYNQARKQIVCACHNGVFDLNGKNVSGPPPKPLTVYSVSIVDDQVIITEEKDLA